ncbi:MAG: RagB/SusD family nutrient uptake outer membrane protein [Bacteroidales bacterium]|nr:RagB/SusD family nutrient uptake outer membrane protein [Bacteroidales bacterium]
MKNKIYLAIVCASCILVSCNEGEFLKETPKDFMSSENSYITTKDFDMAVNDLYYQTRIEFYGYDENRPFDYVYGTDLVYDGEPGGTQRHGSMSAAYGVSAEIPRFHWDALYKMISSANIIKDRIAASNFDEQTKKEYTAKALFFRGMAYRTLAYLYGGVPIETSEVMTPKTDYVRATYEETLKQAVEDIDYAAKNLKDISLVKDGQVSIQAANHLLAEIYLALGENQKAVDAATSVITTKGMALMENRFGSSANEIPGDVYLDLFRMNNQNRGSGNTEAIWVIQYETDLPGGGSSSVTAKTTGNYCLERHMGPMVRDVKLSGVSPFRWPVSDLTGGRGIGWGVSTHYYTNTVWESDWDGDIRNANHNFVRKFPVHNKAFIEKFGITEIDVENPPAGLVVGPGGSTTIPSRWLYAYQSKVTTPGNHPDVLYSNKETGDLLSSAGATYLDQYMFRLAETYLLRAEAYMKMNKLQDAADDINKVRGRAHAKPVTPSEVNMEYILDERVRELGIEEKRQLTLRRTGTLYDHVMKYNPFYADPKTNGDGVGMQKKYELWPIPLSAIEANTDAVLEQNPGY